MQDDHAIANEADGGCLHANCATVFLIYEVGFHELKKWRGYAVARKPVTGSTRPSIATEKPRRRSPSVSFAGGSMRTS